MRTQARWLLVGAGLALGATWTLAQDESALKGVWFGLAPLPGGAETEVRMDVDGAGGTFKMTPRVRQSMENQCLGKPLPMSVKVTGPGAYRIHIEASKALKGCSDGVANVTLTDPQHLDGKFGDGRPLKLKKN